MKRRFDSRSRASAAAKLYFTRSQQTAKDYYAMTVAKKVLRPEDIRAMQRTDAEKDYAAR
jgi:hypothetical protein